MNLIFKKSVLSQNEFKNPFGIDIARVCRRLGLSSFQAKKTAIDLYVFPNN